jgi:hypothetical protein
MSLLWFLVVSISDECPSEPGHCQVQAFRRGVPSHDTLNDVMNAIEARNLSEAGSG